MTDGSLTTGAGVEVTSPILTDNTEDIEDIYMVCNMLQEFSQEIGSCCGGHVHIGSDYLTSKESYANLYEIWGNAEKIFYIISNNADEIPRRNVGVSAATISKKLSDAINKGSINLNDEKDLDEFISNLQDIQKDNFNRSTSLNILNINNGKNTIEFRVANGTLDPNTWIENARLYGRIICISEKLAQIEKKKEGITDEEKGLMELMEKLKQDCPENEKFEIIMEMLFEENERSVYVERYEKNSKLLEEAAKKENNPIDKLEFAESVDFRKHRKNEFGDVARDTRVEKYKNVTKETKEGVQGENLENTNEINNEMEV